KIAFLSNNPTQIDGIFTHCFTRLCISSGGWAMDYGILDQNVRDSAPGCVSIDLGALRDNCLQLQRLAAPARTAAVVKADAYGLGAARIAPVLYDAKCRDFFVAQFGEALKLRAVLADDARIFVLNGLQPGSEATCASRNIIPVLNSLEQVA